MEPRLKTDFWVAAYRRRLDLADIPAFVVHKGDPTAGAVLVKLNRLDGQAQLFQRSYGLDGQRVWMVLADGGETETDQAVARQLAMDPDIWVIEVEDSAGRHLLDEEGLE